MTVRVPAWVRVAVPTIDPKGQPREVAWADTLATLAAEHDARRAAERGARWPLQHRCSAAPSDPGVAAGSASAFCCRALR